MVYVRLFESTEYLDYWQAKENVVCYKNKVFVTQSSAFRLKKDKEIYRRETVLLFIEKKSNDVEMGTPKEGNDVLVLF